ncbi:hypothetical protein H5410_051938 [Solanum commersonii]|uniref:Craniofacial development protein 2-like n=1 Tax=Solanum commersonii TaxID=4109 RepID=A0A9J5X0V7_SOLCO|nr:hypothetical protein H5410_051938 [Solanum commersonii]
MSSLPYLLIYLPFHWWARIYSVRTLSLSLSSILLVAQAKHQPAPVSEHPRKPAGNRAQPLIWQAKAAPARNFARTGERRASFSVLLRSSEDKNNKQELRLYIRFSIFLVDLVPDGGIESCLRLRPRKRESRGGSRDRNGVGILVDGDSREQVVEVRRMNDRLMMIKLVIGGCTLSVISAYAPQVGLDEEAKKLFYENLDEVVRGIPNTEKIVIDGDFNGYIGATSNGFDDVH